MALLRSRLIVDLLVRRVASAGGFPAIIFHGDDDRGTILVQCVVRGVAGNLFEWTQSLGGDRSWQQVDQAHDDDPPSREAYVARRRQRDSDLWLIELDIADGAQLVAIWDGTA